MNEKEKNASIEYILSQGLIKPETTRERIAKMMRIFGLRYIFWDTGYNLFFVALTLVGVLVLFNLAPDSFRCSSAVAVAPLFFLIAVLFAETAERISGLYELKQTCHYTIRQVTAMRVIGYSILGSVFTAIIVSISADNVFEFLVLFPLCLCALFACAVMALHVMRVLHGKWVPAAYSAIWIFVNITLPFTFGETWEALLRDIPFAFSTMLAIIGATLFTYQVSKMLQEVHNDVIT